MKINESDFKYFAGCALTGLSSNPFLMSPEGKLHLTRAQLSIEKLAINSALEMLARLEKARQIMDQLEQNAQEGEQNGTNSEPAQNSGGRSEVLSVVQEAAGSSADGVPG